MFFLNSRGQREFPGGKEDWEKAADTAAACGAFSEDDDAEQVADALRSCYNCRYRRWTRASFVCCKPGHK